MKPRCARIVPTAMFVALATVVARALPSQSPTDRAMLAAWNDSLTAAATGAQLAAYASAATAVSGSAGALRQDLFALRTALVNADRNGLELALRNLAWDASSHHDWPWPSYALADAYVQLSMAKVPVHASGGQLEGETHAEAAWHNLRNALAIDPDFAPARALAIRLLVAEGDRELRGYEQSALADLLKRSDPAPEVLLVYGRFLRTRRNYDSALATFDHALAAGGDRSLLGLERARTLRALGDTAGAGKAYWDGATHLTAAGRIAYRVDLAWIVAPDSLAVFDQVSNEELPAWLRRFWGQRDAEAANRPGERLQEHLRRWDFAMAHYRVTVPWRRDQFARIDMAFEGLDPCVANDSALYNLLHREQPAYPGDLRGREPLLDNRGLVYLHHGQPLRSTGGEFGKTMDVGAKSLTDENGNATKPDLSLGMELDTTDDAFPEILLCPPPPHPNESWLYWFGGDWRVLHFRPSCALGWNTPSTLTSYLPLNINDYLSRASFLPEYGDAAQRLMSWSFGRHFEAASCLPQVTTMIARSRADADVGMKTDSDSPPITKPWTAVIQAFALDGEAPGAGKALVTFAVERKGVRADTLSAGRIDYPITFRIVAYDLATGNAVTIDTTRRFVRNGPLPDGQSLAALFEIPLGPGRWQVAFRAGQGDAAVGAYAMKKELVIDRATTLSLSDIVLGVQGAPSWRATDGAAFPVNVLGAYHQGATADLFYEVHGLAAGTGYRTTVQVRSTAAGAKDGIRIVGSDQATGPVTHVRRSLGLSQLKPGSYRLIITVEANGATASREQPLLVGKR